MYVTGVAVASGSMLPSLNASAPARHTLHTSGRSRQQREAHRTAVLPSLPGTVLDRKWFSDLQKVEIDQCPKCGGLARRRRIQPIHQETGGAKVTSPLWAKAMAEAARVVSEEAT